MSTTLIAKEFINLIGSNTSSYNFPKQSALERFKIHSIDFSKTFLNYIYYFFGIKKRQTEKFTNTSSREILNLLNLFQLNQKKKLILKLLKLNIKFIILRELND